MNADTMVQVDLTSLDTSMTCWIAHDPDILVGTELSLYEITGVQWIIQKVYSRMRSKDYIHHGWHVGGMTKHG